MAIADFQRAFADLIASPQKCLAARVTGRAAFADYALSERELLRLETMVLDEAMSVNCTLYRVNRLTPVYSVLPLTCMMLGDSVTQELDAFWEASRDATLQYRWEAWRFGTWLLDRIASGAIPDGPLASVIQFELACFDVRTAPRGESRKRILRLRHDIFAPDRLSPSGCELLLDATGPELNVHKVDRRG